jgi:pimeloyl-ACP methyl ester carboxylesterase
MSLPVRHVEANGLRFAYLEEGAGPLVLLLHGFPDTAHTWDAVRPRIAARGYRVVSPFLRGYHPSAIPSRDTDLETTARDALGLVEALAEKNAIVIGHDWGAIAAYGAASLDPSRVRKLFVLAIPHPAAIQPTPRQAWGVRHFLAYKLPGASRRFAANDFAALPAIYARWSPDWRPSTDEFMAVRECFARPESLDAALGYYRALSFRVPAFLRRPIEVDTVVFAGKGDRLIAPAVYGRARRMFTKSYVVEEIPGGHFLHREHPDVFAERLLAHV